jgi:hypothetical protein
MSQAPGGLAWLGALIPRPTHQAIDGKKSEFWSELSHLALRPMRGVMAQSSIIRADRTKSQMTGHQCIVLSLGQT